MNQLEAMRIFVRVAETASFTQAAQALGLPKASASIAIQWLENLTGTRLLHRTTRRVQMTQDGQVFYERCKDLVADMEELQELFRLDPSDLQGRLRVDMSVGAASNIVVPRLPEFMATYPNIDIELSASDHFVDVIGEGFDCVLRAGTVTDSSLIARRLGAYRLINCMSSSYAKNHGIPQTLDDLKNYTLIHYSRGFGTKPTGFEYVDSLTGEPLHIPVTGNLTVNNSSAYLAACLAGLGIIQGPEPSLRPHIDNGSLIEILPEFQAPSLPVTLLYGNRRHVPKRVQVFMAWLEKLMKLHLKG